MVRYFSEDTSFVFKGKRLNTGWLKAVVKNENFVLGNVNIIFCSDRYLLDINRQYLNHEYFTDIITFDYCEDGVISGDLFISVDCVRENSGFYKTEFDDELHRVIVHGVLHLIGYDDHTEEEQKTMRAKEDFYLELKRNGFGCNE